MGRRGTQLRDQHSHYQILHNDSGLCSSFCCIALRPVFGQLPPHCRDSGQSSFYKVRMLAPRPIPNLEGHGASYNSLFVSRTLPSKRSHVLSPSLLTFTASKPGLFCKQSDLQSFLHNFTAFKVGVCMCGCFGNMCTCIYCVFVSFHLCIFILFMLLFNFVSYVFLLLS